MMKLLVAIFVGTALGIIASRYLFVGSWLSLILWAIAGLALGFWSQRREAMINGTVYGFVLAFIFMVSGYSGSASLITRLPFFVILGAVGAVCGLILGFLGSLGREVIQKARDHPA